MERVRWYRASYRRAIVWLTLPLSLPHPHPSHSPFLQSTSQLSDSTLIFDPGLRDGERETEGGRQRDAASSLGFGGIYTYESPDVLSWPRARVCVISVPLCLLGLRLRSSVSLVSPLSLSLPLLLRFLHFSERVENSNDAEIARKENSSATTASVAHPPTPS